MCFVPVSTARWQGVVRAVSGPFGGPPGTGKSHLGQAIGQAVIQRWYRVFYRETRALLEEVAVTVHGAPK